MMDRVCQDHAPQVITRKRDERVIVLSREDYETLQGDWLPRINGERCVVCQVISDAILIAQLRYHG